MSEPIDFQSNKQLKDVEKYIKTFEEQRGVKLSEYERSIFRSAYLMGMAETIKKLLTEEDSDPSTE